MNRPYALPLILAPLLPFGLAALTGCDDALFGGALDAGPDGSTADVSRDLGTVDTAGSDVSPGGCAPAISDPNAWPASVSLLPLDTTVDGETSTSGDVASGRCTALDFADDSAIACFPGTQFDDFSGNQVYFALSEPLRPDSIATITMTPTDGADLHIYGYMMNTNRFYVPPAVGSVTTCEAGYSPNETAVPETIEFQNPGDREHNVFFAVSGPEGITQGAFDIQVTVDVYEPNCPESLPGESYTSWPAQVQTLSPTVDERETYAGDLASGACTNVNFAEDSANACFPATEFEHFTGNQVFYALDLPAGHDLDISLTSGDASLWGYQASASTFQVPPAISNIGICEYSTGGGPKLRFQNAGGSAQNVFFAVAGGEGVVSGGYELALEVQPR